MCFERLNVHIQVSAVFYNPLRCLYLSGMNMNSLAQQKEELIRKIIAKGGMLGMAAEFHAGDASKSEGLLKEYFEQCHNRSLWDFWGKELVLDLVRYRLHLLRFQFEQLYSATQLADKELRS